MPIYAVVEAGVVTNKCVADTGDVKPHNWFLCDDAVGIGWRCIDGEFSKVEPQTPEDDEILVARSTRDALLRQSDWTQLADAPVDKNAWAAYRQLLRDVPQQEGFANNIVWPEPPNT